jgi:MFS family permease
MWLVGDRVGRARLRKHLGGSAAAFGATARNRSLLRAQLSFGATWTAEWALTVALGVVAFRDGGATAVGIVAFARMAPAVVLAPLGTAFADRFRRERVLMWSCLIRAGATAGAALLLEAGTPKVPVYALAGVATAAFTVFRPAHSALLPTLCTTPLELTSANVVRGLLDSLSMLLGPLVAALLLGIGSPAWVFLFTATLSAVSGALLVRLSYDVPPRAAPPPLRLIVSETVEGFRALARYRDARLSSGLAFVQTLTRGFLNVLVVSLAFELLRTGASGVGVLTAAVGAGAVAGSLGAAMFVSGRHLAAIEGVGVALWGLPIALCAVFPDESAVLVLMCMIGVGNALVDIGFFTLIARLVPDEVLARVYGADESLIALSVALGSLVAPFVIDLLGVRGALAVLGLVAPVLAGLTWRRLRAIDGSIEHRNREIAVLQKVGMLRPLPMPAIENLAGGVHHAHIDAGQVVFHQGELGDRFYVIHRGDVEVISDGHLVGTLGPGEGFGEIALLRETPRTATVRARTALDLYTLDRDHFVPAVSGHRSSSREAETLVADRLAVLDRRSGTIA